MRNRSQLSVLHKNDKLLVIEEVTEDGDVDQHFIMDYNYLLRLGIDESQARQILSDRILINELVRECREFVLILQGKGEQAYRLQEPVSDRFLLEVLLPETRAELDAFWKSFN